MSEKRFALLIGSYQYEDSNFKELRAPANDVKALEKVLSDPKIGDFEVKISLNEKFHIVLKLINIFFQDRKKDDLLLLYFSGHGLKEIGGKFYLVATDTELKLLPSTGISASYINDLMRNSNSRSQVIILDCCYSGAFVRGISKGNIKTNIQSYFDGGVGKVIITSSDEMQYSFEEKNIKGNGVCSIFTRAIVHGLKTGEADVNEDNLVSVDDLYQYVDRCVGSKSQRPTISDLNKQGDIFIARNPNPKKLVGIISEVPKIITSPSTGMEFVLIPSGKFIKRSPSKEGGGYDQENPIHEVIIRTPFYMGKYPVTQKQWERVMGSNPSKFKGENRPVESISWNDVQDFIEKLNEKDRTGDYRLPSESEWEYACRAGTTTSYSFGDDESKFNEYGWYSGNADSKTHPVGQKKPNPWGLYDMHGNVGEWVQDLYHENYGDAFAHGSPFVSGVFTSGIYRGGSWAHEDYFCRSAVRDLSGQNESHNFLGFRVVREASHKTILTDDFKIKIKVPEFFESVGLESFQRYYPYFKSKRDGGYSGPLEIPIKGQVIPNVPGLTVKISTYTNTWREQGRFMVQADGTFFGNVFLDTSFDTVFTPSVVRFNILNSEGDSLKIMDVKDERLDVEDES